MSKDNQDTKVDVPDVNEDETKKPDHEIEIKSISIEVIGEDDCPTHTLILSKDNQDADGKVTVMDEDETKKPNPEIEIKSISIEVIGEDDCPNVKYSNPWATVSVLSLIVMIISFFLNGIVFIISLVVFLGSTSSAMNKAMDRSNNPWKYED